MSERHENCSKSESEPCEYPKCILIPYEDPEAYYCGYYDTMPCTCDHPASAHFDGVFEYQACLYEGCKCVKFNSKVANK